MYGVAENRWSKSRHTIQDSARVVKTACQKHEEGNADDLLKTSLYKLDIDCQSYGWQS